MSNLTAQEKYVLEKLLGMGTGYVLDFSNHTFQGFVLDVVNIDIYDDKYFYGSGSKANRLRGFWNEESNYLVGRLLKALIDRASIQTVGESNPNLLEQSHSIVERLLTSEPVQGLEAIESYTQQEEFALLAKSIKASIDANQPEVGLDRLHTFTVKHIRRYCDIHQIDYTAKTSLNALFGMYVKYLEANDYIHTEMTRRILKSSISILDSFNYVRNNQSLAHDNSLLNTQESLLICQNILALIQFVDSIEEKIALEKHSSSDIYWDW